MDRFDIRIVGVGGQGIRTAGIVLAKAAVMDGLFAAHWPFYGVETRGGPSISDIIISGGEIDYPRVIDADILVALSRGTISKHLDSLKPNGLLIIDSSLYMEDLKRGDITVRIAPLIDAARKMEDPSIVNMVMLGFLIKLTGIVSVESMIKAIREVTGLDKNIEAFKLGLKL
jgi:2-oxoglutarate ferredoxin oxidoreductase subunit gamma